MKLPCYFELKTYEKVGMFEKLILYIYRNWLKEKSSIEFFIEPGENITFLKKVKITKDTKLIEDLHLSKNGLRYFTILMAKILNRRFLKKSSDFKGVTIGHFSEFF